MGFAGARFELDRPLVIFLRFIQFVLGDKELAEVGINFDVTGIEFQRGIILLFSLIEPAEILEHRCIIIMRPRAGRQVRRDKTCPLDFGTSLVSLAKPHCRQREDKRNRPLRPMGSPSGQKTTNRYVRRAARQSK